MDRHFTLEYWIDEGWYVGRLKEVPGVFSQGETLEELEENIKEAYSLMMDEEEVLLRGDKNMVFQYYPDTDMLYIKLADGISTESEEVASGIVLDFDEHNRVIGVEIEDASKFIDLSRLELRALPIVNLILSERAPAET
jgi:uncharacterized protein YuzE